MNDTISIKKTGKQIRGISLFFLIFFFLLKEKDVSQIPQDRRFCFLSCYCGRNCHGWSL